MIGSPGGFNAVCNRLSEQHLRTRPLRRRRRFRPASAIAALLALLVWLVADRAGRLHPGSPPPGRLAVDPESRANAACPVLRVVDGDTLRVRYQGCDEPVRLLRVNTPERGRPGYADASATLRSLAAGRSVVLRFEQDGVEERDAYGRLLAYVYVGDACLNIELVRLGWSRFWTRYGKGRLAGQFEQAEREARENQRGQWRGDRWGDDGR
jgi:micrococcal nuclease